MGLCIDSDVHLLVNRNTDAIELPSLEIALLVRMVVLSGSIKLDTDAGLPANARRKRMCPSGGQNGDLLGKA